MSGQQAQSDRNPRTILIVLPETGYFRLYGSTIVELERRGWQVRLAFGDPDKRENIAQVPAGAGSATVSVGAVPASGETGSIAALRSAIDYVRYLEPSFANATFLRQRAAKYLRPSLAFLTRAPGLPRPLVTAAIAIARAIERLTPPGPDMTRFVAGTNADIVLVSPLLMFGRGGWRQTEVVKAARRLNLPVIVGVASWDHLTSKGLVRVLPDALVVWNNAQSAEAMTLHRIPSDRVIVTGAQSLDHWFEPTPVGKVAALREQLGAGAARPLILFVGSSRNMAPHDSEPRFVRRWLAALRADASALVRDAVVVVRPHPGNLTPWQGVDLADLGATVFPLQYTGIPLTTEEVETFRHMLAASDVVVGINTTAMIEAAIFNRPVLTIRDPDFVHSQQQTLHFAHLPAEVGGCADVADSLQQHVRQLDAALRDPQPLADASRRFVSTFVRPHGSVRRATDCLCDAIEALAASSAPRVAARRGGRGDDPVLARERWGAR